MLMWPGEVNRELQSVTLIWVTQICSTNEARNTFQCELAVCNIVCGLNSDRNIKHAVYVHSTEQVLSIGQEKSSRLVELSFSDIQ